MDVLTSGIRLLRETKDTLVAVNRTVTSIDPLYVRIIPTALLSDSPGIPSGERFVIHWREEDSRHAISGKIADGFYGR
jgi:hypothetical protein